MSSAASTAADLPDGRSADWSPPSATKFELLTTDPVADPEEYSRDLLQQAVDEGVSEMFITDEIGFTSIRWRLDGMLYERCRYSVAYGHRLRNYLRTQAGTDVGDHFHPSEGSYWVDLDDEHRVFIRLNAIPSVTGQDVTLKIFDPRRTRFSLDSLGYLPSQMRAIHRLLHANSGLVLVAGPTSAGKTTSLYSFLRYLNDGTRKIHTLEEPCEYVMPGVVQSQVNLRKEIDFADLLTSILRSGPDVIMVGEIRDRRTAEIAVRAGGTGQLVFGTIHAHTAVGAIQAMLSLGVHPHFLANTLTGVIGQRLVRRMCTDCRNAIPIHEAPSFLRSVRNEEYAEEPRLYFPIGCDHCTGGYRGQMCLAEILEVDDELAAAIADGVSGVQIRKMVRDKNLPTFQQVARAAIAQGVTTAEEICRRLTGLLRT